MANPLGDATQKLAESFAWLGQQSKLLLMSNKDLARWERENAKDKENVTRSFAGNVRDASDSALGFTRAFIQIPTTISGLIKQSVAAASPGTLSTLTKSWDLVMAQIGKNFIPAILTVSKALQGMARAMESIDFGAFAQKLADLLTFSPAKALKELVPFYEQTSEADKIAEQLTKLMHKEERIKSGKLTVVDESGRNLKESELAKIKEERAALMTEFRKIVPKAAPVHRRPDGTYGGAGDVLAGRWDQERGRFTGRGSEAGLLTDLKPPGYQARYTGIEQLGEQLQLAALNITPIEAENLRVLTNIYLEALKANANLQPTNIKAPAR